MMKRHSRIQQNSFLRGSSRRLEYLMPMFLIHSTLRSVTVVGKRYFIFFVSEVTYQLMVSQNLSRNAHGTIHTLHSDILYSTHHANFKASRV